MCGYLSVNFSGFLLPAPPSPVPVVFIIVMSAPEVVAPAPALPPRYTFVPHSDMEPMIAPSSSTIYCAHCTLPVDYCEFSGDATLWELKCKPNIVAKHVELYPHLEGIRVLGEVKVQGEGAKAEANKKQPEVS